jgi:hypothetical protein
MTILRLTAGSAETLELVFTGKGGFPGRLRFVLGECAPEDIVIKIRAVDEANQSLSIQERMDVLTALIQGKNWGVITRINSYTLTGGK